MATIVLRPEVYDKAAAYARKERLNVDDWVNKILLKMVVKSPAPEERKPHSGGQNMFRWDELSGIFASDKSDKELRDEYLEEKYHI